MLGLVSVQILTGFPKLWVKHNALFWMSWKSGYFYKYSFYYLHEIFISTVLRRVHSFCLLKKKLKSYIIYKSSHKNLFRDLKVQQTGLGPKSIYFAPPNLLFAYIMLWYKYVLKLLPFLNMSENYCVKQFATLYSYL